jgi:opacity protein-like surface antigen
MKLVRFLGTMGALAALSAPLQAQQVREPLIHIAPYAGYMSFGSLVSGPFGSRLSNGGGAAYGAQVSVSLSPVLGVYGNVAYSRPGFEVGLPIIGGISIGDGSVLVYDGGVQFSLPGRTAQQISPFVQAGIGGMKYSFDFSPIQLEATNLAYNVGVGADLPLSHNLGIRVLAKDYIGKFDTGDIIGLDVNTRTTHNWALSVGVTLGF